VREFYTRRAKLYQKFFITILKWEEVLRSFFRDNGFLHSQMKILDAGCGTGSVTKVLYELADQQDLADITFHGFDLTQAMLDIFHQWIDVKGAQNIHVHQADVLDLENQLPGSWNNYDLIVSSTLLEYIPEEKQQVALRNLKVLLNPTGRLLLLVTKRIWITRLFGALWWKTNLFDRDALAADLQRLGFDSVRFWKMPSAWNAFILAVEARVSLE
jgi:SAM-dependent methyltransferase